MRATGKKARKQRAFQKKVGAVLVTRVVTEAVVELAKTRRRVNELLAERYTWLAARPRLGNPTAIERKIREAKLLRAALARSLKVPV